MTKLFNKNSDKKKRIFLRSNQTSPEEILWKHLRNKKMRGVKFRRQYGVGMYVLDFYAPAVKLAIEIDGPNHSRSKIKEYDKDRELAMNEFDITFIRFSNEEIEKEINNVLNRISKKISDLM